MLISFSQINQMVMKNPNKKLFMDVIQKNGTRGRIFCSKNIGEAIRANRVELSQLLGLDVILTETSIREDGKGGDPMLVLIAPTSSTLELEVGNTVATAYEAETKKIAWEDLAGI